MTKKILLRISILLFFVSLILFFLILPWILIDRIRFIGAAITFIIIFWSFYFCKDYVLVRWRFIFDRLNPWRMFIESHAELILGVFVMLVIGWLGMDIFLNPYLYDYNHGNGAYCAQLLHNICNGLGPENTVKYNDVLFYHSNPYYYASAFSAVPHILPYLLLPPLYWLYPNPPMHVFAVVILVLVCGSFGIYLAARTLDGSKTMALVAAMGFCLLPWVERPILMHGHFDVISYAIYPYVFASLFSRRWMLFYIFVFLLAIINMPYTYSVMALGVIIAIFFRAPKQGIITSVIGLLVMLWDKAIIRESLRGIWDLSRQPTGTMRQIFFDLDFSSFIQAALHHVVYIFLLLLTVAFIPILGIKRDKKWNWPLIGVLLFAVVGAVMGMFRSYDVASHRNANMVVPIYLSTFMVLTSIWSPWVNGKKNDRTFKEKTAVIIFLLFSGFASMNLWFSYHYPWAVLGNGIVSLNNINLNYIKAPPVNNQYNHILSKMREYVPYDASVAYRIDASIQAYITNRQKAWYLGYHPEGVEYYFIQTKEVLYIDKNLPPWREYLIKVESDKNNKLLYEEDGLVIYKNLSPKPIPRLQNVLGWDILYRALLPGQYK
ncbi:MAG: hypothetical protein NTZ24_12365 [Deltaproteobacteria bacterium]|nr:hypothetical protein [Deltaproteobacteria bacterium]